MMTANTRKGERKMETTKRIVRIIVERRINGINTCILNNPTRELYSEKEVYTSLNIGPMRVTKINTDSMGVCLVTLL
jgi:hypothetical protein